MPPVTTNLFTCRALFEDVAAVAGTVVDNVGASSPLGDEKHLRVSQSCAQTTSVENAFSTAPYRCVLRRFSRGSDLATLLATVVKLLMIQANGTR